MENKNVNKEEVVVLEGQEVINGVNKEESKENKGSKGSKTTNSKQKKETEVFSARLPKAQKEALSSIFKGMDSEDFAKMVINAHQMTIGASKQDLFSQDSLRLEKALATILEVFKHGNSIHQEVVSQLTATDLEEKAKKLEEENAILKAQLQEQIKAKEDLYLTNTMLTDKLKEFETYISTIETLKKLNLEVK